MRSLCLLCGLLDLCHRNSCNYKAWWGRKLIFEEAASERMPWLCQRLQELALADGLMILGSISLQVCKQIGIIQYYDIV